jgi:hypothetical protein
MSSRIRLRNACPDHHHHHHVASLQAIRSAIRRSQKVKMIDIYPASFQSSRYELHSILGPVSRHGRSRLRRHTSVDISRLRVRLRQSLEFPRTSQVSTDPKRADRQEPRQTSHNFEVAERHLGIFGILNLHRLVKGQRALKFWNFANLEHSFDGPRNFPGASRREEAAAPLMSSTHLRLVRGDECTTRKDLMMIEEGVTNSTRREIDGGEEKDTRV